VDRPSAAVDPVNGKIFVWWAASGSYYVNTVTIAAAAGSSPVIGNPDSFPLPSGVTRAAHGSMAIRHDYTSGGSEVMFAWPDGYGAGDDCPSASTDANGYNSNWITWYLSSKVYGGGLSLWSHHEFATAGPGTYLTCVDPAYTPSGGGDSFYGVGALPQIAYDPGTNTRFIALGRSYWQGSGVRTIVYSSTDETHWTWYDLRNLSPNKNTATPGDQWRPSIAILPQANGGKLAVGYYSTEAPQSTGHTSRWAAMYDLSSGVWQATREISIAASGTSQNVPWFGNGSNGDYVGMAAELSTGTFTDVWPDNRNGTTPSVWSARFHWLDFTTAGPTLGLSAAP
jgi:hypothetical protein